MKLGVNENKVDMHVVRRGTLTTLKYEDLVSHSTLFQSRN